MFVSFCVFWIAFIGLYYFFKAILYVCFNALSDLDENEELE